MAKPLIPDELWSMIEPLLPSKRYKPREMGLWIGRDLLAAATDWQEAGV